MTPPVLRQIGVTKLISFKHMKVYEANAELADIFKKHGFIEVNSRSDSEEFRNRHLSVIFDGGILIKENNRHLYSCTSITEEELKFLFLYFKLNNLEKDILFEYFSFTEIMRKGVDIIDHKRRILKRDGNNGRIINKLARILLVYSKIEI